MFAAVPGRVIKTNTLIVFIVRFRFINRNYYSIVSFYWQLGSCFHSISDAWIRLFPAPVLLRMLLLRIINQFEGLWVNQMARQWRPAVLTNLKSFGWIWGFRGFSYCLFLINHLVSRRDDSCHLINYWLENIDLFSILTIFLTENL